jgi:hypothetical protein
MLEVLGVPVIFVVFFVVFTAAWVVLIFSIYRAYTSTPKGTHERPKPQRQDIPSPPMRHH